jgi:hypothetical protein
VIRGAAAPTRHDGLCLYDTDEISKIMDRAADSIFGSSKRPHGFCQNSQRGCQKKAGGKCDLAEHQTCTLNKPDRFYFIYQQGSREEDLFRKLGFSSLPYQVPQALYGKAEQSASFCEKAISELNQRAALIEQQLRSGSALLLPPKAFGRNGAVRVMLDRISNGSDPTEELRNFRQNYRDKVSRQFIGRSNLGFKPAQSSGLHGAPHDNGDTSIALTRRYRLGCKYDGSFHWDVGPLDGSHLDGAYRFDTRDKGMVSPKGKYANVLVDDCLR